jgi:hypothetical protein
MQRRGYVGFIPRGGERWTRSLLKWIIPFTNLTPRPAIASGSNETESVFGLKLTLDRTGETSASRMCWMLGEPVAG